MNDNKNSAVLAVKNVKNAWSAVHQFPLNAVTINPTMNIIIANMISAMYAFQCFANPNSQWSTSPAPVPSMLADIRMYITDAIIAAVVCIVPVVCVCIIASARYERNIPIASVRSPIQIDILIALFILLMFLKASFIFFTPEIILKIVYALLPSGTSLKYFR